MQAYPYLPHEPLVTLQQQKPFKKTGRKTRKSPMLSLFWQMTWDMEI